MVKFFKKIIIYGEFSTLERISGKENGDAGCREDSV